MRLLYILIISLTFNVQSFAADNVSFLQYKDFEAINNIDRESESWATCSAVYGLLSEAYGDSSPAESAEYKGMANGAAMAIMGAHLSELMVSFEDDSDIDPARFAATLKFAQLMMAEQPTTSLNSILASLNRSPEEAQEKLLNSFQICLSNLEFQQANIDIARSLMKSGLLN